MFHPVDRPMDRGWVGRIDGDEVVHLAAQTLQHFFTGGGGARDHARYRLDEVVLLSPLALPPSIRAFDGQGSFAFENPAAVVGPGAAVAPPDGVTDLVADAALAGLVAEDGIVAIAPALWLRAPSLARPKDRDFAIGLGPWFTTRDDAPLAAELTLSSATGRSAGRMPLFDWEEATALAGRNTKLRTGDLIVAAPAATIDVPARGRVGLQVEGYGALSLDVGRPDTA